MRKVDVADFTVLKQRQQQVWATGDYATVGNTRSCTCNERIIAEPEKQVVYPSSIIMEGGRHGT
jgi:hypothetical protein